MKLVLRDYQQKIVKKGIKILKKYNIVMLAMAVRTGKSHTALSLAKEYGAKKILVLTKKKAISSITEDSKHYDYEIIVINYESLNKIKDNDFDLICYDEVHAKIAGFPKPSASYKAIKKRFSHIPAILLSGTPLIESASKAYPIFTIYKDGPFSRFKNFYRFFDYYGIPKKKFINSMQINDYTNIKYDKLMSDIEHLIVSIDQQQAGFKTNIQEHVLKVKMKPRTYTMVKKLIKNKVLPGKDDNIIADTGAKLQLCLLQMFSGTIKLESGKAITLDDSKAQFLKQYFKGKKIAILTCFVQEVELLKEVLGDLFTDDLQVFDNDVNKWYIGNIVANREGVSLKSADALVFFNIPFSGTSFVQGRDRASHIDRKENNVYFICAENGIEEKVLEIVRQKKSFTNKIFENDYLKKLI